MTDHLTPACQLTTTLIVDGAPADGVDEEAQAIGRYVAEPIMARHVGENACRQRLNPSVQLITTVSGAPPDSSTSVLSRNRCPSAATV